MRDRVIIVEALSTGFNLVQDCLDRGLEPVILEVDHKDEKMNALLKLERAQKYCHLDGNTLIIKEDPCYEKTLEMVKNLQPKLVIPGAEDGVVLAVHLATDLGLPGNPYSMIDRMTNKYYMHKSLEEAGVRHIRGKVVHSREEAERYYDALDVDRVVIKPPHGAASMGVRFCDSKEMLLRNYDEQCRQVNIFGEQLEGLMIQERIIGTEYIVNTISIGGEHFVSSIWRYDKRVMPNGSNVYVGTGAVTAITPKIYRLVQYAFSVLDAIGIKQGPVHGEYMIDEKGPVLIEVNCRCMGGSYSPEYGNLLYGHHETDLALDSYLDPDRVRRDLSKPYRIKTFTNEKNLICPENMSLAGSPILGLLPYLRSYYSASIFSAALTECLDQTTDLETAAGSIRLVHDDYAVLRYEYNLLCELEKHYFGLIYQDSYDENLGSLPDVEEEYESVDFITLNQRNLKNYPLEDVYQYFKELIRTIKPGGFIRVPEEIYNEFPYGAAGIMMIFRIMNFTISLPRQGCSDIIMMKADC